MTRWVRQTKTPSTHSLQDTGNGLIGNWPCRDSSSVEGATAGMGRTGTEAVDTEEVDEVKTVGGIQPHGTNEEEEKETRGKEEQAEVIE